MLDTRHAGRDEQPSDACDAEDPASEERSLLGSEQESWFFDELAASQERGARWRLVGQQVMVAQFKNPASSEPCVVNVDGWGRLRGQPRALLRRDHRGTRSTTWWS